MSTRLHRGITVLLLVYGALCLYLFRSVEATGDGAAYVLQAAGGSPWERSLHVGYLAPLWLWVRGLDQLGIAPSTAANLLAALWTAAALVLATFLGNRLASHDDSRADGSKIAALLAPATLLAASTTWDAALFAEVYGPLGALMLGTALALVCGRDALGALLLAWAALVHPGAWALVPGLLMCTGLGASRRSARVVGLALLPWAVALAALAPEWWSGSRGVLALPDPSRSAWESLQGAWRLLSRDLGIAGALLLLGATRAARPSAGTVLRSFPAGIVALALGAGVGLDRYDDNPGQLPTLWMACCLAPCAANWIGDLQPAPRRRLAGLLAALVLALCMADATSSHDARARSATRETEVLTRSCAPEPSDSWATARRRSLACLP